VLTDASDAHIDGGTINATGAVDVTSTSSNAVTTKADSSSTNTPTAAVGAGIAAAANVVVLNSQAYLSGDTVFGIDTTAVNVGASMPDGKTNTFSVTAISGASSGAFGASGAFAMGVTVTDSHAYLAAGSSFDGGANNADLNLEAVNRTSNTVKATAQKKGATGFGAGGSLALNVGVNKAIAEVDGTATLTDIGSLSLIAEGEHALDTTAEAGSSGDIALTPAVALSVGVNETKALLPDGIDLVLASGLAMRASHSGTTKSRANANAAGKNAGFGVGVALNVAVDDALAEMDRNVISMSGDTVIEAHNLSNATSSATASALGGQAPTPAGGDPAPTQRLPGAIPHQRQTIR
jgi:hypothetical protein